MKHYTKPEHITFCDLDNEFILLNIRSGEYFSLNPQAAAIFKALCSGADILPEGASEAVDRFNACARDLLSNGLLELSEVPQTETGAVCLPVTEQPVLEIWGTVTENTYFVSQSGPPTIS